MTRSPRTQEMLNYFDPADSRVRESQATVDAQLLNAAALALDDFELRSRREIASRSPFTSPAHLDNRGLWYQARIPPSYTLPPDPGSITVEGLRDGDWIPLPPYDDRLPVPARIELDPSREPVPLTDPVIADLEGSGSLVSVSPGELALPNRLSFWLEPAQGELASVDVLIEGERHPRPAWGRERDGRGITTRSLRGRTK